jgi:site-specific recombinase XerD
MLARPSPSLSFPALVQQFFCQHLTEQRGLSPCTVASYRDAFMLFLEFVQTLHTKPAEAVTLADFTPELIQAFLDHLEHERGNTVHSRNIRLAALRAFLKFAARCDESARHGIERSLHVPMKRFVRPKPEFLSRAQILAVIGVADGSWLSQRDHMLLSLLYNTGATVSEIIALRVSDMALDAAPPCVRLGDPGRLRSVPLWSATMKEIQQWLQLNPQLCPASIMLPNQHGGPMTPSSVRQRLALAVRRAAVQQPELARRSVSPRSIRHTAAMHLLQCGTDVSLITQWLGHENPVTMHNHARAYRDTQRVVLQRLTRADAAIGRAAVGNSLMEFLKAL